MNARGLFILLALAIMLAFTRRFRKLGMSLSVALLLLLVWFNVHMFDQALPIAAPPVQSSSTATQLTARLLSAQLTGNGAPWHVTGEIHNTGTAALRSLTLSIERSDCPTPEAAQADCLLLWQGTHVALLDIAAGATTQLDEAFYSHDTVPRVRGVVRDVIKLIAAS